MTRRPLAPTPATLALALALALVAPVALAYPDPDAVPFLYESECLATFDRSFVYDYERVMDPSQAREVEGAACAVYATTGAHFVLVTVNDTERESLESYALHVFETWGVGSGERNDGVMLLYVADGDQVRIEVGYGLEHVVNTLVAADALDLMSATFERSIESGDRHDVAVANALTMGSAVVLNTLNDQYVDGHYPQPDTSLVGRAKSVPLWVWIVLILIVVSLVASLSATATRKRSGWGYYPGSPHWSSGMGSIFASQMGRGGGGWGGGGFGGGRSGGGGGSGRL